MLEPQRKPLATAQPRPQLEVCRLFITTVVGAVLGCSSHSNAGQGTLGGAATAGASSAVAGQVSSGGQGGAPAFGGMATFADAGGAAASGSAAASAIDAAMPADGSVEAGSGGSDGGAQEQSCDLEFTRANRALVARAIDELFVDKDITAIDRHWADPYHQHNPIAQSGVSTFRSFMSSIIASPSFTYERLLTLADCDRVVVYGRYSQTGVFFDMFRVRDDKIMEHWDSDAGQASPVGEIIALDEDGATVENRILFEAFSSSVLIGAETDRASELLSAGYVEHHGSGATGPRAFAAFLEAESATYTRVHHVIADGNYVFALSEGMRGSSDYGFYDLFRVQAGKLAEHWDSRRAVPNSTMSGLGIF